MRSKKDMYEERKHIWKRSRVLSGEKLSFLEGTRLGDIDIAVESNATVRKVRRILEKRISQEYWRNRRTEDGNGDRQSVRRRMTRSMRYIYGCVPEGFRYIS